MLVTVSILCCIMPLSGAQLEPASDRCTVSNAVNSTMCTLRESFLNKSINCCQRCSACPVGYEVQTPCNTEHDTYCVPTCPHKALIWNEVERSCIIDCSFCSHGCDSVKRRCTCDPNRCYNANDLYCDSPKPCNPPTLSRPTVSTNSLNPSSLPPWGIGVIAVGAVLGIIAFSAGFLLMGVCTRKKRVGSLESGNSENSDSVLVSDSRVSRGTNTTYISGYPNQSLLDLLRNTNISVHNGLTGLNSANGSPKSARISPPSPVRTIPIKLNHNHLHSSVVWHQLSLLFVFVCDLLVFCFIRLLLRIHAGNPDQVTWWRVWFSG